MNATTWRPNRRFDHRRVGAAPAKLRYNARRREVLLAMDQIYGPKTMIINEMSGSGGDALPWMFKQDKVGPLVARARGRLVGIWGYPARCLDFHFSTAGARRWHHAVQSQSRIGAAG